MMNSKSYLFIVLLFSLAVSSPAQKTIPVTSGKGLDGLGTTRTVVKTDPLTRLPIGSVPFDKTFLLRIYFDPKAGQDEKDEDVRGFYLVDKKGKATALPFYLVNAVKVTDYDAADPYLKVYPNAIDIVIPALAPNKDYQVFYETSASRFSLAYINALQLFFNGREQEGIQLVQDFKKANHNDPAIATGSYLQHYYRENKAAIDKIFNDNKEDASQRNAQLAAFMNTNRACNTCPVPGGGTITDLFGEVKQVASINTQQFDLKTSASLRIVADGGVIYTGWQKGFNAATAYAGINISLRPMDPNIPFRTLVKTGLVKFYQRFTINLGITLNTLAKDNYRANLFSNNNVMAGIGYKLSHAINLNLGGLLYYNIDSNPLTAKKTLGIAPYAGISINLLIKDALGDIAKVFSYAK